MIKKTFLAILILIIVKLSFAEIIDGPANIRQDPQGELLFSLYDSVKVSCTILIGNWYEIGISIPISEEEANNEILKKGRILYDKKGNEIGQLLSDISISPAWWGTPRNYSTEIRGYTYKNNIRPNSIPELLIENLIKSKDQITIDDLTVIIRDLEFNTSGLLERFDKNYKEYMVYDTWLDDPSPTDRLRLILKDNLLIAIVHSRPINQDKYSDIDLVRDKKIIISKNMTDQELKDFIKMNEESYWGID